MVVPFGQGVGRRLLNTIVGAKVLTD